jgi:hypothetical protein
MPFDPLLFFADAATRNFDLNNEALPAALI